MKIKELKKYKIASILGALGAFLMMVGDLCLSVIKPSDNDSGLFVREAYLSGAWEKWRLPLLVATGLVGMSLGVFSVFVSYKQVKPQYRKTRLAILVGGIIYVATAGALHLFIGSLADWTTTLSSYLERTETISLVTAYYKRMIPSMYIAYAGMILLILTSAFAVITKKTIMPRWMIALHMIVFQIVFVIIPDICQMLHLGISTWDFILSQASGNAALCIWMVVNAVWAGVKIKKIDESTNLYD